MSKELEREIDRYGSNGFDGDVCRVQTNGISTVLCAPFTLGRCNVMASQVISLQIGSKDTIKRTHAIHTCMHVHVS